MNGDESMAQGAAFYAANLSHSFKVRPVFLNDGFDFQVNLTIKNLDSSIQPNEEGYINKSTILYTFRKNLGTKKLITLSTFSDLRLELTLINPETGLE